MQKLVQGLKVAQKLQIYIRRKYETNYNLAIKGYSTKIYVSGTKIFDIKGNDNSDYETISWKIYDVENSSIFQSVVQELNSSDSKTDENYICDYFTGNDNTTQFCVYASSVKNELGDFYLVMISQLIAGAFIASAGGFGFAAGVFAFTSIAAICITVRAVCAAI